MIKANIARALLASTLALTAACTNGPEISKASSGTQKYQHGALSDIARKFIRQTPETVHFSLDHYFLDQRAKADIDIQAAWILRHPNVRVSVYGHTDKVGNSSYNDELGLRRANVVLDYLVSKGVNPARLEAMVSHGEDLPFIKSEDRTREGRRVTTLVAGFLEIDRSFAEGANEAIAGARVPNAPGNASSPTSPPAGSTPPASAPVSSAPSESTPGGSSSSGSSNSKSKSNSGRGNGDEGSDPGKSGGKNKGGDE